MQYRKTNKKFGQKMPLVDKLTFGWCFLLVLIITLIFPMLLFSTLNPNYIDNNPVGAQLELDLWTKVSKGNIKKFLLYSVDQVKIKELGKKEYSNLQKTYEGITVGTKHQFRKIIIPSYSSKIWIISPPKFNFLKKMLNDKNRFYLTLEWKIKRTMPPGAENAYGSNTIILSNAEKVSLLEMINDPKSSKPLHLESLSPKFIHLGSTESSNYASYSTNLDNNKITSQLSYVETSHGNYWRLKGNKDERMEFYTFNDLVIGQIFGASLKNLSVITFYATIVLAIGRLIRGVFAQIIMRVMYEEMPYCEDIIEFCDSIYMARKDGDLMREQKLYELLIRMYRSPEILINLTKDYLNKEMIERSDIADARGIKNNAWNQNAIPGLEITKPLD